ncbi:hypothetical protein L1049_017444 [Liquidambar formosana]|uniref:Uncharacterized protein n=1 Tax=Liquidambar formosana TaxID=63359 RepID=A0AAP0S478_LIQFO
MDWHLFLNSEKFWVHFLSSKYYRGKPFSEATYSNTYSWLWKGILKCKDLVIKGTCFVVGDGLSIDLWKDPWIPNLQGFRPRLRGERRMDVNLVSDLILPLTNQWNIDKVSTLFEPADVPKILRIHFASSGRPGLLMWMATNSGEFSIQSAYSLD